MSCYTSGGDSHDFCKVIKLCETGTFMHYKVTLDTVERNTLQDHMHRQLFFNR